MPYCPKCSALVESNAQFCDKCGTPLNVTSQTPPAPPPAYGTAAKPMQRPTGITILAVLAGLAGLALIIFGLITALFGIGIIFLILGLVELAVAYAFWSGASWGWWIGIIVALIDIISIITLNVVSFVLGIAILYYITRPHVRAWFHES